MMKNHYSGSDENSFLLQRNIYYTFFYGTISFVVVLVALLLLYVSCSKKYRLNWFEKNLLETVNKADSACSQDEYLSIATESEVGSSRSILNLLNEDKFWVPVNQSKNQGSNDKTECSGDESTTALPGSRSSLVSFSGEESADKEPQPIARSGKQVVLSTTKPVRPRVCSMNTKLDHTKIDSSLYQEAPRSPVDEGGRGFVNVSMSYDHVAEILTVRLLQAKELLPRDFSGTSDPYAKIRLLPDCKNVWQTRIHKKTLNPVFDEDFVFEVSASSLSRRILEIVLYDFDAYSRHLCLGEVRLPLSEFDLSEKVTTWKGLEPCANPHEKADLGDLMVTLSFLQSAERLTVVVNKARNLRVVDDIRLASDPYVKVSLIQDGRRVKKKKTSAQRATVNPVFNEHMTFDVSKESLSKMSIEFSVYHDNKLGSDEFLGGAVIGSEPSNQPDDVRFFKNLLSGKTATSRWLTLVDNRPKI